jgi:hypothetical protein
MERSRGVLVSRAALKAAAAVTVFAPVSPAGGRGGRFGRWVGACLVALALLALPSVQAQTEPPPSGDGAEPGAAVEALVPLNANRVQPPVELSVGIEQRLQKLEERRAAKETTRTAAKRFYDVPQLATDDEEPPPAPHTEEGKVYFREYGVPQ